MSSKAPADAIIVKDADLLFNGDFKRAGSDLIISRGDHELRLDDYFKGDKHAPLASPDGAYLTGKTIDALTGHVQIAQADGSAATAKIIGHVTKLTGSATVVRNGVSVILNNGDNVFQGDVVQSGSNSTVGITFIDGSVFGLASNAKMVLNEMVYDPNGSSNSSFLSLVAGTISFVAGATAKHGDMKVDTPVATMGIRGTAVVVEIDFEVTVPGSAPPARFQVVVEPDGTSGSFVLLDRVTLAPIATVNQPGTVTTVSGAGAVSFLASAQLSPELMKLISEVFSQKFTDNSNPKSDTHFTDIGVLQNTFGFNTALGDVGVAVVHLTQLQESASSAPPPPPGTSGHIPGPPGVATFNGALAERTLLTGSSLVDAVSGNVSYTDPNPGDVPTVKTAFDHFTYHGAAGQDVTATLTAEQLSAIAAVSVPLVVVQDAGGKNNGTATWTYSVGDHALDFLAEGETLTLTYMARVDNNFAPNNETTFKEFTITITGTNDVPTIVVSQTAAAGEVVEDIHVNASGNITAGGTVIFDDVDLTDTHTATFVLKSSDASVDLPGFAEGVGPGAAHIGTFALLPVSEVAADGDTTGAVAWTFTLDDDDPVLQSLAEGQTITQVYTITVSDGHGGTVTQDVTVTITGANDSPNHPPVIVGELTTATGDVVEDTDVNSSNEVAADGIIVFKDVDLIDTHTAGFVNKSSTSSATLPGFVDGTSYIGTFALDPVSEDNTDTIDIGSVGWKFTLDDDNPVLQSLAEGQTITQVYTVTVSDGHAGGTVTQDVTVTITGTNDTPTIEIASTTADGGVTEDTDVNGSNDITTDGTVVFQDVDLIDTHTAGFSAKSSTSNATLPGFVDNTTYIGSFALDPVSENNTDTIDTASVGWTFTLDDDNPVLQSLAEGQTITQVYTVTISDGHIGGTVTQDVTVTITGTNDAPTVEAASTTATGGVTEDTDVNGSNEITTDGTVTFQDLDLIDTHTADFVPKSSTSNATLPGFVDNTTYIGTFALTPISEDSTDTDNTGSVGWTFTLDDDDPILQSLAAGETITQVYTITVSDGHGGTVTQDVTVTITGTNDGPNVTPIIVAQLTTATGEVTEDTDVNASNDITADGTIAFQDVDLIDTHTANSAPKSSTSSATLPGFIDNTTYIGKFALAPVSEDSTDTGNIGSVGWTFTLDDDNPVLQSLAEGQTITQVYTVTVSDGHAGGTVTQDVTITITGTNDAPTIETASTTATGGVTEDTDINGSNEITTGGTVAFQDVDLIDTHTADFTAKSSTSTLPGFVDNTTYIGSFALDPVSENNTDTINTASVGWTFTLDDDNPVLQSLAEGQTITQVYTVTVSDGHIGGTVTQDVTVTITGTNDAPTVETASTTASGAVTEDTDLNASNEITTDGTVTFQDLDLIDTHTADFVPKSSTSNATLPGFTDNTTYIGTFALTPVSEDSTDTDNTGSVGWTFKLDDTDPVLQSLAEGETITQVYTVTVSDGHTGGTVTQDVTVTITGTNDAPTVEAASTTATGGVTEDTDVNGSNEITAGGTVTFQDLDLIDTHTADFVPKSSTSSSTVPGFTDNTTYIGTFALTPVSEDNTDTSNTGSVGWTFTLDDDDPILQSLAAGETITQVYTVTVTDGHTGGTVTQDITVTITGTDEPARPIVDLNDDTSGFDNVVGYNHDGNSPVLIAADALITDADSQDLQSMTVTLTNPLDNSSGSGGVNVKETLSLTAAAAALAAQDGLTVTFSAPSSKDDPIILTITGSASVADYQAILAGVQYEDAKTGHHNTDDRIVTVVVNDGTLDSEVHTVTVTNSSNLPHGPVIGTDQFTVSENPDGTTTVTGLYVTDVDTTAPTDTFTVTAVTAEAPGSNVTPGQDAGSLAHINSTLATGITYDPGADPPDNDMVTFTVSDGHGHSDLVNFVFHEAGIVSSTVTLTGTSEKDVIFATGHDDILTGGANADQFVFTQEHGPSHDTITDFTPGQDHIDLRDFAADVNTDNIDSWLASSAHVSQQGADTLITLGNGGTITLQHVAAGNLHATDFIVSHPLYV